MKTYQCSNCGKESVNKKKISPSLCQDCYFKKHRRSLLLLCRECHKPLNPKSALKTKLCRNCFLKANSTKFKNCDYDDIAFGNWLMGFVDGEGNFSCNKEGRKGFVFRIILREDDKAILEKIREKLGVGKLFYRDVVRGMNNWNPRYQSKERRNRYAYTVNSVYDLVNTIVPYFERYQLRAKKRQQYESWRNYLLNRYAFLREVV